MKTEIITIACIFAVIPIAFGMYGSDTLNYPLDRCEKYNVTISPCDIGEWEIEGCNETSTGFWICNCTDNYVLNMTPAKNSVGNFVIEISYVYLFNGIPNTGTSYYYVGTIENETCTPNWDCNNWSECVNGEQNRICTDLNNCNTTVNKPVESSTCSAPSIPQLTNETAQVTNETNTETNQTSMPTGFFALTPYLSNPIVISLAAIVIVSSIMFFMYSKKIFIFKKKFVIKENNQE